MNPGTLRLLQGIRAAAREADQYAVGPDCKALLGALDVLVNELILRQNLEFYVAAYARAWVIANQALEILRHLTNADLGELARRAARLPHDVHPSLSYDLLSEKLDAMLRLLEDIVTASTGLNDQDIADLLEEASQWEVDLYAHWASDSKSTDSQVDPDSAMLDREHVGKYVRARFGDDDLKITGFRTMSLGLSKRTVRVDIRDRVNDDHSLVIRAERPNNVMFFEGSNVANEFPVLKFVYDRGIPVPEPLWLETDRSHIGGPFIVSRLARGSNFGTSQKAEKALSDNILRDMAAVFARIHGLALDRHAAILEGCHLGKWLEYKTMSDATRAVVRHWRSYGILVQGTSPSPLLASGFDWLLNNVPDCTDPPVLTHCDYGLHNVLIENDRISAVLDWESAQIGDPAEEMAVFLDDNEKFASRDRMLQWYLDAGGKEISEYRLRYFRVFYAIKATLHTNFCRQYYERHPQADIKLAVHGLRSAHFYARRVNDAIERAESVKPS